MDINDGRKQLKLVLLDTGDCAARSVGAFRAVQEKE